MIFVSASYICIDTRRLPLLWLFDDAPMSSYDVEDPTSVLIEVDDDVGKKLWAAATVDDKGEVDVGKVWAADGEVGL